jgi:type 1 fimbria pilin
MKRKTVMTKAAHVLCLLALALAQSTSAFGQADVSSATLKGTVMDQTKAAVAGATVTAKSVDRGTVRIVRSNSEGVYQIPTLQPGAYELRVEAQGFGATVLNNITLRVGEAAVVDVELTPGGIRDAIQVTTDVPLIEVERTQQANSISSRQV